MTTRKISVTVLAGLAALSLSACSSTKSAEAAASKTASTTTEELVPNACGDETYRTAHAEYCSSVDPTPADPVSAVDAPAYTWADTGIKVEITKAVAGPAPSNYLEDEHPDFDTKVDVTVTITNTADQPFLFPQAKMYVGGSLAYGVNGYDANSWMADHGSTSLPARLVPGTSATMTEEFTAPAAGVAEGLTYSFSPDSDPESFTNMQDHVWTDVQKLAAQ